ncbi:MAG: sensor histidine kinase N-terminal domain-containing protein [Burkholderiales bacterium]|nr:sensor histidine kinase N-terminal domain-containing protein [Burkholderiales bacterium]
MSDAAQRPRAPRSLQWRISLWVGFVVALLWIVAAVLTAQKLRHEMDAVFDRTLEEAAQRLLPLAVLDVVNREEGDPPQRISTLRRRDDLFTYVVRDAAGAVLLRSHNADVAAFPPYAGVGFVDTPTQRIYFDAAMQGNLTIAVAEPLAHRREVAGRTLAALAWPLAVLVPLSLGGVWLVVRGSLGSIRNLRQALEARGRDDLSTIGVARLPAEIVPLTEAVNRLLDRLRHALLAERRFTAHAAHELRTPVAAALAQAQRLAAETSESAVRERARQIETALRRLARLAEKILQLARAEGGELRGSTTTDAAQVVRLVVDEMARRPAAAGRITAGVPDTSIPAAIDADALAIVVRNLVENALTHGAVDAPVAVTLAPDGTLTVTNDGPSVPPDVLARLTRPFERGQAQGDGTGLGLAIVSAIASATGAKLALASPPPGRARGFVATFVLPRADSPR